MIEPVPGRKLVLALLMRLPWAAALVLAVFGTQAGVVFTTLHSFPGFPNGRYPYAGLVQASDGNFYGTTSGSGTYNSGTVFRISTNGVLTSLYSFTGGNDGAAPFAGLVQGGDGYFYGTTEYGGTSNSGTVFKISANGALTSLYSFTGGTEGANPTGGLIQASDGNLYGTASGGDYYGTIFRITTNGAFTLVYSFTGADDGAYPEAALIQASDGHLYGTASAGGINGRGTVFRMSVNGDFNSLFSFNDTDGSAPVAALLQAADGYLYGTTSSGSGRSSAGIVFRISTNGAFNSLYLFTGGNDGGEPNASLMQTSDGSLYGTTAAGGTNGAGTVFRISNNGALTSLYSFTGGADGANPQAGLVQGSDGILYGTTEAGGTGGSGAVFEISTTGVLTSLYSSFGVNDGANPTAGLVQGSDSYFYGTTEAGYFDSSPYLGYGTVFRISPNGALTSLHTFSFNDGAQPFGGLLQASDGNFYGTTTGGGTYGSSVGGYGTVFRISPNGALTTLYSFTGTNDGANPEARLVEGRDGYFYGTTAGGGDGYFYGTIYEANGTVFKISTNGALTTLYSFTGHNDGAAPYAGLVQGGDGYFYGTTSFGYLRSGNGTVFKINTSGALTTLYSFSNDNGTNGANPYAGLVQGSDGNFYGTTGGGGTNDYGTVFRISTNGALTCLYSFTGGNDGGNPQARLVQGSDGNFYGTTYGLYCHGVPCGNGTVFQISPNGALTTLYSFTGGSDGGNPEAALVQGTDGNFYGTTRYGGQGGAGTIFRLTIVPEFQYTTNNGTITITGYTGSGGAVTIPDTIYGLPVTRIAGGSFFMCGSLTSVTIGTNVTSIGDGAFSGCTKLTSVYFQGNAPSLGVNVFSLDNNATVYYLSGTTGWGTTVGFLPAFLWDPLVPVAYTINNGTVTITKYTGPGGAVTIPDTISGLPVTSIGTNAFSGCTSLTSFTIPSSVTSIGTNAFAGCTSLISVYCEGNAPTVDQSAFSGDSATVYYLAGTTSWSRTFGGVATALWWLPNPLILNNVPTFGVQSNGFGFVISWAIDVSVVVETCTNLGNPIWYPLSTNTLVGGSAYFSDPQWANYASRFYRLRYLASSGCVLPPSGLAYLWPGEGNAVDSVSGNNGTLQGGVTYTSGEVGQAFNFDGASGFITTSFLITNPQTFTLSLWFRTTTTQGGVLISFDSSQTALSGSLYDRNIYMDNSGALHFGFWNPGPTQINSASGYNDNHWHFAVGSLSASTGLSFYVDGVLVGNDPAATTPQNYNGYWRIGEDNLGNWPPPQPSSYYFSGQIDEVAIFNRVLYPLEVYAIYAAGSAGMCKP